MKKEQISSSLTPFFKYALYPFVLVFYLFALMILFEFWGFLALFLILPWILILIFYYTRVLSYPMVFLDRDYIYLIHKKRETKIPLHEVAEVKERVTFGNPREISIYFNKAPNSIKKIAFLASYNPGILFSKHPTTELILKLLDRARMGSR